jgi:hypothetical protein
MKLTPLSDASLPTTNVFRVSVIAYSQSASDGIDTEPSTLLLTIAALAAVGGTCPG